MAHPQRQRPRISLAVAMIMVACAALAIVWTRIMVSETREVLAVWESPQIGVHVWLRLRAV